MLDLPPFIYGGVIVVLFVGVVTAALAALLTPGTGAAVALVVRIIRRRDAAQLEGADPRHIVAARALGRC